MTLKPYILDGKHIIEVHQTQLGSLSPIPDSDMRGTSSWYAFRHSREEKEILSKQWEHD